MANKTGILIVSLILFISGCSSVPKPELSEAENIKAKEFLSRVNEINTSSPNTISSSFSADGNSGEKKFRVEGKVTFDKKGYYKVTVFDYVFQSPIMEAYRELEKLFFFYPAEKKLLTDDVNKIDLSSYTGFKTDYKLLYTLLTGGIPLLDKYVMYKCLYDEKEKGYNLIIQNDEYFENIFFKGDVPEKILLIHKQSRNKIEIYLKSNIGKDKSVFFKKCRIVAPEINLSINISFSKPVLNTEIFVERMKQDKLAGKVEVIKVN